MAGQTNNPRVNPLDREPAPRRTTPRRPAPQGAVPQRTASQRAASRQAAAQSPSPQNSELQFGGVAPARAQKQKEQNRGAKAVGAAIVAIALVAAVGFMLVSHFGGLGSGGQAVLRVSLSEERVNTDLQQAELTLPDLEGYNYVSTASLIGPRYSEITIGEVERGEDGSSTRAVTTTARYANKSIEVLIPITSVYTYLPESEVWEQGEITQGEPTVAPTNPPSNSYFTSDLSNLLDSYSSGMASKYSGCQTTVESGLTAEGGKIYLSLMKVDDRTTYTCDLEVDVVWDEATGWKATVASANEKKEYDEKPPASLKCNSGDTVTVSGTVAGTAGSRLTLNLDQETELTIDGSRFDTHTLSLVVRMEDGGASILNQHVTVTGSISSSLATQDSPAGVAASSITLS